jgi:hypothetical protein
MGDAEINDVILSVIAVTRSEIERNRIALRTDCRQFAETGPSFNKWCST